MKKTIFEQYSIQELSFEDFRKQADLLSESSTYNSLGLSKEEFTLYQRFGKSALDNIIAARNHKCEIILKWKFFSGNK